MFYNIFNDAHFYWKLVFVYYVFKKLMYDKESTKNYLKKIKRKKFKD